MNDTKTMSPLVDLQGVSKAFVAHLAFLAGLLGS